MTWRKAVLDIILRIGKETFTAQDLYDFADELARLFPSNMNIEAKIRQQLQYLRDEGVLDFVDNRGSYRLRRLASVYY